jgi:hypothetical protein
MLNSSQSLERNPMASNIVNKRNDLSCCDTSTRTYLALNVIRVIGDFEQEVQLLFDGLSKSSHKDRSARVLELQTLAQPVVVVVVVVVVDTH